MQNALVEQTPIQAAAATNAATDAATAATDLRLCGLGPDSLRATEEGSHAATQRNPPVVSLSLDSQIDW
jgi:hypothetical protein